MAILVQDPGLQRLVSTARAATGADRYDEVWEGIHVMPPMPNSEHQQLATRLATICQLAVGWDGQDRVFAGINVSDRIDAWTKNYRIPDVAVFLAGTTAHDYGTHWHGGPDLAIEITSPGDQTRHKLPFYAAVRTRELLLIERDPYALELFRLNDGELRSFGRSTTEQPNVLRSELLPLSFTIASREEQPVIVVTNAQSAQSWTL